MLQQDEPDDYILASGVGHTVAEFAERRVRARRPATPQATSGSIRQPGPPARADPAGRRSQPARERLGWRPTLSFEQLVDRMVEADLRALQAR